MSLLSLMSLLSFKSILKNLVVILIPWLCWLWWVGLYVFVFDVAKKVYDRSLANSKELKASTPMKPHNVCHSVLIVLARYLCQNTRVYKPVVLFCKYRLFIWTSITRTVSIHRLIYPHALHLHADLVIIKPQCCGDHFDLLTLYGSKTIGLQVDNMCYISIPFSPNIHTIFKTHTYIFCIFHKQNHVCWSSMALRPQKQRFRC